MRQQFRLRDDDLRTISLQRMCDRDMQLAPPIPDEAGIRGVLNQGMLEDVTRIGRRAAREHDLGFDKPRQAFLQVPLGQLRGSRQQPIGEVAPYGSCDLCELLAAPT